MILLFFLVTLSKGKGILLTIFVIFSLLFESFGEIKQKKTAFFEKDFYFFHCRSEIRRMPKIPGKMQSILFDQSRNLFICLFVDYTTFLSLLCSVYPCKLKRELCAISK